ncbi:MAG: SpoIIE family protein phosphatase [Bacteroidota bacterium]
MTQQFEDAFIYFAPRDIVSGDFYWFAEVKSHKEMMLKPNPDGEEDYRIAPSKRIIVAADCTGHGVPGAFMTVMGNDFLDEIVNAQSITRPDRILERLDKRIKERLHGVRGTHGSGSVRDGMDMSILVVDEKRKQIQFAGAKNPLCRVRDGKMEVIKGSPYPLGSLPFKNRPKIFQMHTLDMKKGDIFYLYSDGFQDQFGGKKNRKYLSKRFRQFLYENSSLPMKVQKAALIHELKEWQGDRQQTDDILVVGVKV